jgi:hypothetical protein
MVPVRDPRPVVAVTVTESVALPVPPLDDSEIHVALSLAVQAQDPFDAVSVAENVAPEATTVMLDGDSVNVHAGAITAAACVIATAVPAIVTAVVRSAVAVLAPTLSVTVPEPVPLAFEAVAHA